MFVLCIYGKNKICLNYNSTSSKDSYCVTMCSYQ